MIGTLATSLALSCAFPPPQTADYAELTDAHSEVVNFFPEPSTAMLVTEALDVWTINPQANTLLRFDIQALIASASSPDPVEATNTFVTGINPVAIARFEPDGEDDQVLVVCSGTHGVFVHRASDGEVIDFIRLETENPLGPTFPPKLSAGADIVIDSQNEWAFVSCPSTNAVVKIDLSTTGGASILDTYQLPVGERPGPMVLELQSESPMDNRLLVAMTITGNNSTLAASGISVGVVFDLTTLPPASWLPDEDVYLIDPFADTVSPYVTNAGSLIFDMERNPNSGNDLWILSTDSINSDPTLNTEPLLRGRFAVNQLARVDDNIAAPALNTASVFLDVDDTDPSPTATAYSESTSVNQARTMAVSAIGNTFIASRSVTTSVQS